MIAALQLLYTVPIQANTMLPLIDGTMELWKSEEFQSNLTTTFRHMHSAHFCRKTAMYLFIFTLSVRLRRQHE